MNASLDTVRTHAQSLLTSIGVSRIVVVDDLYRQNDVEDLIGLCATLPPEEAAMLPHLSSVDFHADQDIWIGELQSIWETLPNEERASILAEANAAHIRESPSSSDADHHAAPSENHIDASTATSLRELLASIADCDYITLSLGEWKEQRHGFLADDEPKRTVFLFDKDFSGEGGATDEGILLIREVQRATPGCCALLTHTVTVEDEDHVRRQLAAEYKLRHDTFVVIAKSRLTGTTLDLYQFLRMLRFVGLSRSYAKMKSAIWEVFRQSLDEAESAVEGLSIADFDAIVFRSSQREGVWEADTLFRLFGIFMRREAEQRLRNSSSLFSDVSEARVVSAISAKLAKALGARTPTTEAQRIQRFENYDSSEDLNRCHIPIGVGDIFEATATNQQYILLTQPCDVMVRAGGERTYDREYGKTGALVELVSSEEKKKERWEELLWYREGTEVRTFVDFARVHEARLAILDLCVFRSDGLAKIDVEAPCPAAIIDPWKRRYRRLVGLFRDALDGYEDLEAKEVAEDLKLFALPRLSGTVPLKANTEGRTVDYGFTRVSRLRQPRSGALLSAFRQYHARAAFEHPFE